MAVRMGDMGISWFDGWALKRYYGGMKALAVIVLVIVGISVPMTLPVVVLCGFALMSSWDEEEYGWREKR